MPLLPELLGFGPQLRAVQLIRRVEQPVGHGHEVREEAERLLAGGPLCGGLGTVHELECEALEAVRRLGGQRAVLGARVPCVAERSPHGVPHADLHLQGELPEPALDAGQLDDVFVDAADRVEEEDAAEQQQNDEDREPHRQLPPDRHGASLGSRSIAADSAVGLR